MFRNAYQNGFLSILYSCGSSPLAIWGMQVKNGYIKRVTDQEVRSLVLEIAGTNVTTTFITCPKDSKKVLGIKLPFLIMLIKNMKKYFTFEITILDDTDMHRRFRMSNFQSFTRVGPFCTTMPIGLSGGWNQIQFNIANLARRIYGTNYVETTRVQIHANCRIRRIYFADRLYPMDEMPVEFMLFLPSERKLNREAKARVIGKEGIKGDGDQLPDEPPQFLAGENAAVRETGKSKEQLTLQEEFAAGPGVLATRQKSDTAPRKSVSLGKLKTESQLPETVKPAGVTIREGSEDETEEESNANIAADNLGKDDMTDKGPEPSETDVTEDEGARTETEEIVELAENNGG